MDDIRVIRDPKVARLLADRTRCRILALLRLGEFSASDLARALGLTTQAISYHLRLLEKAGLVRVVRTETKRNLVEKYYRAVAKRFVVSYLVAEDPQAAEKVRELLREAAEGFRVLGYEVDKEKGAEILREYMVLRAKALEEVLARKRGELPRGTWLLLEFLALLRLFSDPKFKEFLEKARKVIRESG